MSQGPAMGRAWVSHEQPQTARSSHLTESHILDNKDCATNMQQLSTLEKAIRPLIVFCDHSDDHFDGSHEVWGHLFIATYCIYLYHSATCFINIVLYTCSIAEAIDLQHFIYSGGGGGGLYRIISQFTEQIFQRYTESMIADLWKCYDMLYIWKPMVCLSCQSIMLYVAMTQDDTV